jgi:hypothetical protein
LWVATSQCLNGSASRVNTAEKLNLQLRRCNYPAIQQVHSTAFRVALDESEARLYVSWKQSELETYTKQVQAFLLERHGDFLEFRNRVRSMID